MLARSSSPTPFSQHSTSELTTSPPFCCFLLIPRAKEKDEETDEFCVAVLRGLPLDHTEGESSRVLNGLQSEEAKARLLSPARSF